MKNEKILLDHGSGGLASQKLISALFLHYLDNPVLREMEDAAVLAQQNGRLAFSTDSYVVDPIFFPGGDIGELAVNGTINDLAMRGAEPLCLSLGLIIEEGFPMQDLEKVVKSVANACNYAQVAVVTGDTKVVPKGKADKIFINTSGIGVIKDGVEVNGQQTREGDVIIVSGHMADHGITIMTSREGLQLGGGLKSDSRPLHFISKKIINEAGNAVHTMRDPTRGGLGTVLSELAKSTGLCMEIEEEKIPMRADVRAACELMGLDPLYLANEGKCMVIVAQDKAEKVLKLMQTVKEGKNSAIIGRVSNKHPERVVLHTMSGGSRLVEPLSGEPLPRIC